jgi:hypothetical protein
VAISHTLLRHPITAEHLRPIDVTDPCPTARFALVRKADVPLTPHASTLARYIAKAAADLRHRAAGPDARAVPRTDVRKTPHKGARGHSRAPASSLAHIRARG